MFTFTSYVLRNYYHATEWNDDNLYSNLTRSSTGERVVNDAGVGT